MPDPVRASAGAMDDLPSGGSVRHMIGGLDVLVCRVGAEVFAIENRCSHAGLPLERGRIANGRIYCPAHGAAFDLRTGQALAMPAIRPVRTFPAHIVDGLIEIEVP